MNNSTVAEAISISRAQQIGLLNGFTHVIKVTGKYYLPSLERELLNITSSIDIVYQHTTDVQWQNSEIFGFNVNLLGPIYDQFLGNENSELMERGLYNIHQKLGVESYRMPPLEVYEKVARADGSILSHL
jgi:hypothetical protein